MYSRLQSSTSLVLFTPSRERRHISAPCKPLIFTRSPHPRLSLISAGSLSSFFSNHTWHAVNLILHVLHRHPGAPLIFLPLRPHFKKTNSSFQFIQSSIWVHVTFVSEAEHFISSPLLWGHSSLTRFLFFAVCDCLFLSFLSPLLSTCHLPFPVSIFLYNSLTLYFDLSPFHLIPLFLVLILYLSSFPSLSSPFLGGGASFFLLPPSPLSPP